MRRRDPKFNPIHDISTACIAPHIRDLGERSSDLVALFNNRPSEETRSLLPEAKLWLRVLHDAILTYFGRTWLEPHIKGHGGQEDLRREAVYWLFYDERGTNDVGSFLWICRMLDIEPDLVLSRCLHARPKIVSNRLEKFYS